MFLRVYRVLGVEEVFFIFVLNFCIAFFFYFTDEEGDLKVRS